MGAFENLGQALRWLRSRQHRKQYEIAGAAGITKAMLSAYETGKQNPSIETLEKILEALSTDLADLHHALVLHRAGAPATHPDAGTWYGADRLGEASSARADLYRTLELDAPLPAEPERALGQMLDGFHALLRYAARRLEPLGDGTAGEGSRDAAAAAEREGAGDGP